MRNDPFFFFHCCSTKASLFESWRTFDSQLMQMNLAERMQKLSLKAALP